MREDLGQIRDRRVIDRDAEALRGLEIRQLPEPTEQAIRGAPPDEDLAGLLDPHVRAREERQVLLLLARGHHGQLVLAAKPLRGAQRGERADEAPR